MGKKMKIIVFASLILTASASLWAQAPSDIGVLVSSTSAGLVTSGGTNSSASSSIEPDEFTGSANYSIEIPTPPARGGVKPTVSLSYNSSRKNSNSWVGYGWELELGAIVRIPDENGLIDYYSGKSFEIRRGGQSEALKYLGTLGSRSSYGNPADYGITPPFGMVAEYYQAQIQGSFTHYIHLKGVYPEHYQDGGWVAIDKSGVRYFFGDTPRDRETPIELTDMSPGVSYDPLYNYRVMRWYLSKVLDPNQNELLVNYNPFHSPTNIHYQDIDINFVTHPFADDANVGFYPLFRDSFLKHPDYYSALDRIDILKGAEVLQSFQLRYTPSSKKRLRLLSSIQQMAGGERLPETRFNYYGEDELEFSSLYARRAGHVITGREIEGKVGESLTFADMNGDALQDQVVANVDGSFEIYFNNGKDFIHRGPLSHWTDPFIGRMGYREDPPWRGKLNSSRDGHQWLFLMDINGDALPDRIVRSFVRGSSRRDETANFLIAFNTGHGWSIPVTWRDPYVGEWAGTSDQFKGFIDMNGDGLVDRVVSDRAPEASVVPEHRVDIGTFLVFYNTGNGFKTDYAEWHDPTMVLNPTNRHRALITSTRDERIYTSIKDFNGDGLPDRVIGSILNPSSTMDNGFVVFFNNGNDWSRPRRRSLPDGSITYDTDGYTVIAMLDPIGNTRFQSLLGKESDLIDVNGDGFLDRVEASNADGCQLKFYFYRGLTRGSYSQFSSATTMQDPVVHSRPGYDLVPSCGFIYNQTDGENPESFLFLQDMNGDGFPDRSVWRGRYASQPQGSQTYETYYLHMNAIHFASAPLFWDDKTVNQPADLLKEVSDDAGGKMAMEYQPTARPRFELRPTHRFLPFNLYTIYKLYQEDYNFIPLSDDVSAAAHPGMRWTEYNFLGGNFYVRHAQNSRSEDITAATLTLKRSARFNGFQEVSKKKALGIGEAWSSQSSLSYYRQSLGDIDSLPADLGYFDAEGYGPWPASGRPYLTIIKEGPREVMRQETRWEVSCPPLADISPGVPVEPICFPKMTELKKFVYEAMSTTARKSKVSYEYDENGNITKETHSDAEDHPFLSLNITYVPQSFFGILKIRDRPETQTKKDASNNVLRKKAFEYDRTGNPVKEHFFINPSGTEKLTVERSFSANGNLERLIDIDGVVKDFGYDADGLFPTSQTLTTPSGTPLTTLRTYDRLTGEISQELGPQNIGSRIERDAFGRVIHEILIDQTGHETMARTTSYAYTNFGINGRTVHGLHVHQESFQPGYTAPIQSDSYSDFAGNLLQKCSQTEQGNFRRIQYRIQNAGRTEIQAEPVFSVHCDFISTMDPMLRIFRNTKDLMGRNITIDPPPGDMNSPIGSVAISYSNNSAGELVKTTTNARGQVREEVYDAQDRVVNVKDPLRTPIIYQYNAVGDLTRVSADGHVLTTIDYDLLGRKKEMTDADTGRWLYSYNTNGQLDRQTDARGHYVKFRYDALGRLRFKEYYLSGDLLERREDYTYDSSESGYDVLPGELFQVSERDASGNLIRRTRFDYHDDLRHQTKISRFVSGVGEFHQSIEYDYLGRVTHTTYPGNKHLTYQYMNTGVLMKVCEGADCTGEIYYSLNPRDAFDVFGNLHKETFGNGVVTDYEYYPASHRLRNKKVSRGSNQYFQRNYQYDQMANVTDIDDPLNPITSIGAFNGGLRSLTYDSLDRLSTYAFAGSARMERMDYDAKGNIQKNTASFGDDLYQYTSSHPHAVTQIGTRRFNYDANGNMISDPGRRMYYNAANQMTRVEMQNGSIVSYDYDYTGSRVKKRSEVRNLEGGIVRTDTHYLGDAIEIKGEQVIQHISAGSLRVATRTIGNLRDIAGNTAGGTLIDNGIDLNLNGTMILPHIMLIMTFLLLASMRPMPTWRVVGQLQTCRRVYCFWKNWTDLFRETLNYYPRHFFLKSFMIFMILLSQFQPMSLAFADEGRAPALSSDRDYFYYAHDDHLGSSALMTEGKETARHSGLMYHRGDLLQRFEYAPFGKETYSLNPNLQMDPSYTGQKYDIETGLYFYKSRYYDPILGRFIQPDTIVPDAKNLQAYNRYTYVNNNPLKYVDPSGHFWGFFKKLLGAFVGAFLSVVTGFALAPFMGAFMVGMIAGLVGGVVGGAISGGLKGALWGGLLGMAGGLAFGAGNWALQSWAKISNQWVRAGIIAGIGATISGATGGWEGLVIFAAGMAGAAAGYVVGKFGVTKLMENLELISAPEERLKIQEAINKLKETEWATTNEGKDIIHRLEALNSKGRINIQKIHNEKIDGYYNKIKIAVSETVTENELPGTIAHEGSHALWDVEGLPYNYRNEFHAYEVGNAVNQEFGFPDYMPTREDILRDYPRLRGRE